MTEIIFAKKLIGPGKWKIDLIAKDLPKNFLGLATDLQFKGDFAGVNYQGMEWGAVVADLPLEKQPIKMVKALPEEGKVVMGLTFKANQLVDLGDGVLASLMFEGKELQLEKLQNPVLSIYENGRKDWQVVGWTIEDSAISTVVVSPDNENAIVSKAVVKIPSETAESAVGAIQADVMEGTETNWDTTVLAEIMKRPQPAPESGDSGWWWLILLVAVPLILAVGGWGLRQAYRRSRFDRGVRDRQRQDDFRPSNKAEFA